MISLPYLKPKLLFFEDKSFFVKKKETQQKETSQFHKVQNLTPFWMDMIELYN